MSPTFRARRLVGAIARIGSAHREPGAGHRRHVGGEHPTTPRSPRRSRRSPPSRSGPRRSRSPPRSPSPSRSTRRSTSSSVACRSARSWPSRCAGGGKVLGWKVVAISGGLTPETICNAWNQVVHNHPSAAMGTGFPEVLFSSQLATLKAEKIPVINGFVTDRPATASVAIVNGEPSYTKAGTALADFVLGTDGTTAELAVHRWARRSRRARSSRTPSSSRVQEALPSRARGEHRRAGDRSRSRS